VSDSQWLRFYADGGLDARGRRLEEILAWDDAALEAVHDYIQWLFPLPEPSAFNPAAPLPTHADIAAFRANPALRARLLAALARMRRFYGLAGEDAQAAGQRAWLTPGNHNFLRITRILRSLTLLGCAPEARALLGELERLAAGPAGTVIGERTLRFWREAVRLKL